MMNQNNYNPMNFYMMLNMMNLMYPNNGYNINNYNMYNNAYLNNLMINWINMNPNLQNIYQNMAQNNNINQNNNMNNQNNNNSIRMNFVNVSNTQSEQINKTGNVFKNVSTNLTYDLSSPFNLNPKANIILKTQKNQMINLIAPFDMKVKDLLSNFVQKLGLGIGVMEKSLFFLFNGFKIDINEEKNIVEYGLDKGGQIIVMDIKEVIGS